MRVAIESSSLRQPLTGIGHYVHRLIGAMLPLLSQDEHLLSFGGRRIEPLDVNFLARVEGLNSRRTADDGARSLRRAADQAIVLLRQIDAVRRGYRALQARYFLRAEKNFDVFHAVNFVTPAVPHKPVLPFIHDLSHIRYPQAHPKERVEWLDRQLKLLVDVPYVQTNSQFSKSEIIALLGVSPDRIYVTYAAPGIDFQPNANADESLLTKHKLASRKYFLFVGTHEPRKNFKTVAAAYTALTTAMQAEFPLVWIGPPGWGDLALSPAVERAKEAGRIRLIGYVPNRDLAALYRNTALFVMPSVYEGFGMPVVEAMACGARVALSRIPVFAEIAGDYARYVEPMDVEGWHSALKDAVEGHYELPNPNGVRANLQRFSWTASAATTLDLYRRLYRGRWSLSSAVSDHAV
jgi:glycosyltransferase involved in cell wall biosynthesis